MIANNNVNPISGQESAVELKVMVVLFIDKSTNQRNISNSDILAGFIYNKITDLLSPITSIITIESIKIMVR